MKIEVGSVDEMVAFGQKIGQLVRGGTVIELIGDVGAGKTTLVRGIATGLKVDENIQSPTFTIQLTYHGRDGLRLCHYDFYRLTSAGIMSEEIEETLNDPRAIIVVEWAGAVAGVLSDDRLSVTLTSPTETSRNLSLQAGGQSSRDLLEKLAQYLPPSIDYEVIG